MQRKTLIIAIIIVIIVIVGIFVWFFTLSPSAGENGEGEPRSFFGFLPFGGGEGDRRPILPEDIVGDISEEEVRVGARAELKQLTAITVPISGAIATTTRSGLSVRYIERETGNVYDVSPDGARRERVTNTTVPAVREAFFNKNGTALLLRYLNDNDVIRTFAARVTLPGEKIDAKSLEVSAGGERDAEEKAAAPQVGDVSGELVGGFLDDDISFVAPSPDNTEIFYVSPLGSGIIGTTATFLNENRDQMFDSTFIEWLPQWPKDDTIALTTKASAFAEGFLYFLDSDGGALRKVLGEVFGLTTLTNPSAERVAFSASAEGSFDLYIFDIAKRQSEKLSVTTLPEKCVWSKINTTILYCGIPSTLPKGPYPDMWYQGLLSFSDTLWRIDTETSAVKLLAVPQTIARENIDVTNPFLDASETYLFFTNKTDSTFWSLKIEP